MKLRTHLPALAALAVAAAALLVGTPSHAASYSFSQTGFDDGASITGSFAGEDGDGDGWLFLYELSDFSLSFSGNAVVSAFTHSFANGSGPGNFAYRIGSPSFDPLPYGGLWTLGDYAQGDVPGLVRYASFEWEAEGLPGGVIDLDTGAFSTTRSPLQVAAVPEPESYALWLLGLAGVGAASRRRRRGAAITPTLVPGPRAAVERTLRRTGWAVRDAVSTWATPAERR